MNIFLTANYPTAKNPRTINNMRVQYTQLVPGTVHMSAGHFFVLSLNLAITRTMAICMPSSSYTYTTFPDDDKYNGQDLSETLVSLGIMGAQLISETRRTSPHYGIEGFKGVSQLGTHYAERRPSIRQPMLIFAVKHTTVLSVEFFVIFLLRRPTG